MAGPYLQQPSFLLVRGAGLRAGGRLSALSRGASWGSSVMGFGAVVGVALLGTGI